MRVVLLRAAAAGTAAVLAPLLAASPAAACDSGIGFRPEISFSGGGLSGGVCGSGTSLAGAAVLALVAIAVVAAVAVRRFRHGEQAAVAHAESGPGGPDAVLDAYLDATGIGAGRPGTGAPGGTGTPGGFGNPGGSRGDGPAA